ncbi:hypothetical protein [Marivirga harenae]|uniref:hypothetical protein n=1 Tax=Marivirga harenae TaxID=2010992 RepID=UPI0026DFF8AD|nr:hypothetical protein [Marivirga harenae]WKV12584.1 hypothetical protein Q3Y49_01890 [Marivirga harenae]
MKKALILSSILVLLFSCSDTETKKISSIAVEMSEEYPMEGSNTLTGIWQVDLDGIDINNIRNAKVKAIRVEMEKPKKSDLLEGIIMQLAASGTDMQRVAVLNPVETNLSSFEMSIADEQENLVALLKQDEITFVADVNLKEEPSSGFSIKAQIEFEVEVKQ